MPSSSYNKQGESRNESARPVTTGRRAAQRKILQVRPPEPGKYSGKAARTVIEAEFLPLVAAAHEFKTPLVVMLGYTDLLHRGELGPINTKQREVLREMQEGTERLQKVIQNLLLLCELRSSNAKDTGSESTYVTDVNENIKELFNYWRPAAKLKSIRYGFRRAGGVPRVAVEPLRLQHIVSNLIENALNYTPKGGRVEISATSCFGTDVKPGRTRCSEPNEGSIARWRTQFVFLCGIPDPVSPRSITKIFSGILFNCQKRLPEVQAWDWPSLVVS